MSGTWDVNRCTGYNHDRRPTDPARCGAQIMAPAVTAIVRVGAKIQEEERCSERIGSFPRLTLAPTTAGNARRLVRHYNNCVMRRGNALDVTLWLEPLPPSRPFLLPGPNIRPKRGDGCNYSPASRDVGGVRAHAAQSRTDQKTTSAAAATTTSRRRCAPSGRVPVEM